MFSLLCASFVAVVATEAHSANGGGVAPPLPHQPHPDDVVVDSRAAMTQSEAFELLQKHTALAQVEVTKHVKTHPHAHNGTHSVNATYAHSTRAERRMKRRTAPLPKNETEAEPVTASRQAHVVSEQMQAVNEARKNHVPRAKLNGTDIAPKTDGSKHHFRHARNSTEPAKPIKVPKKGTGVVRGTLNGKKAPKNKLAKYANKDLP